MPKRKPRKPKKRYLPPKNLPDSWKKKSSNRVRNGVRNGFKLGVLIFSSFGFITSFLVLLMKQEKIPDLIGLDSVRAGTLAVPVCICMALLLATLTGTFDKDKDGNWTHKGDGWWPSSGG